MKPRQSSYDAKALKACGEGQLFEQQSPKLPTGQMLMFDRVTHISETGGAHGHGEVIAELDIDPSHWFFACHFLHDPVMPGCLGVDAMWQLLGFFMSWSGHPGRGRALGAQKIAFNGEILPETKTVTYQVHIKRMFKRSLVVGLADGITLADGKAIYHASGLRVGLLEARQQQAIA